MIDIDDGVTAILHYHTFVGFWLYHLNKYKITQNHECLQEIELEIPHVDGE